MPQDLTDFPKWKALVESNSAYRKAWLAGTFPPSYGNYRIVSKATRNPSRTPGGPGTELHRLLESFWLRERTGCGCGDRIAQMDRNGPAWCRKMLDSIVGWLTAEAHKRGWTKLPTFTRWGCRVLVLLAIRRAERAARKQRPSTDGK